MTSNRLPELAAQINAEHAAANRAIRTGIEHAMAAGDLLIEAKALLRHGEWGGWLAANCVVSERSARVYMRLARNRDRLEIGSAADLSLRAASQILIGDNADEPGGDDDAPIPMLPLGPGEFDIAIDHVKFRPDLYARLPASEGGSFSQEWIARLEHFAGYLPAIELNQRHEIIDGVMRWYAHQNCGAKVIRGFVTEVTNDDEHWKLAIKRNATHGEPLPLELEMKVHAEYVQHFKLTGEWSREAAIAAIAAKQLGGGGS
jgi:hypothetical protein